MSKIRNQVQLIGHLGKDPEVTTLEGGRKVLNVSIATNENYKNRDGEAVDNTQWHNVVAWGKTAELMGTILKKGSEVAIQGKIVNNTYVDKDGITRYSTNISVNDFLALSKKN